MKTINKIIELHEADPLNCQRLFRLYKTLRICMSKEIAYEYIFHNILAKHYIGYTTMSDNLQTEKIK